MLPRLFKKRPPRKTGIDAVLARVSILDGVTSVRLNDDGPIAVYVTDPLDYAVPRIVGLINELAPGTQGMVHRLIQPMDATTTEPLN